MLTENTYKPVINKWKRLPGDIPAQINFWMPLEVTVEHVPMNFPTTDHI